MSAERLAGLRIQAYEAGHGHPKAVLTLGMELDHETAASRIAKQMTQQREILVLEAIDYAISHKEWTLADTIGRGEFRHYTDGETEFSFDGNLLLTFYPIKTQVDGDARSQVTVTGVQKYRRHYERG